MPILNRSFEEFALLIAGYRDQDRARGKDRRAGQCHARNRRILRHRIGHDPDSAACLRSIESILKVRARKKGCRVTVFAHAQPDKVGRPGQILQARIRRIAGKLVVRNFGSDRDDARAVGKKSLRNRANVAPLIVHWNEPLVRGDDRQLLPRQLLGRERLK